MPARPKSRPTPIDGSGRRDDEVELGFVAGVFGVRGEVRLHLHNREESVLFDHTLPIVLVAPDDARRVGATLSARSGAGKRILGRIEGVDDPEAAILWMNWRVLVARDDLPDTDDDEFYVWQLEGLAVEIGGQRIGTVVGVHETEGSDVLEVAVDGDDEHAFVPLLEEWIEEVDLEGGRVLLAPGALESPEEP